MILFWRVLEIVIATSPYDSDSGEYDIDSYMDQLLQASRPEKRGWCRPGFTMNPVLNRCVPTMRAVTIQTHFNSSYMLNCLFLHNSFSLTRFMHFFLNLIFLFFFFVGGGGSYLDNYKNIFSLFCKVRVI